jgi:hypothetical protein
MLITDLKLEHHKGGISMTLVINHIIENDTVYRIAEDKDSGLRLQEPIGQVNKVEVVRIDDNTVADVTYQFDLDLGEYVELSRLERPEPLPPPAIAPEQRIIELEQQLAQTNADLQAVQEMILFP